MMDANELCTGTLYPIHPIMKRDARFKTRTSGKVLFR